jgi:hypothetical protein
MPADGIWDLIRRLKSQRLKNYSVIGAINDFTTIKKQNVTVPVSGFRKDFLSLSSDCPYSTKASFSPLMSPAVTAQHDTLLVSLLSLNTTLILQMAHSRFIIQVL